MGNNFKDIICNGQKFINSYVILDLETTGLPHLDGNRTKITEIALISVLRQHILEKFITKDKDRNETLGYIPRTINKLSECVYPCRKISMTAADITGLDNTLLEPFHPFDETLFNILMGCFDRLQKPICIIAHNGLNFDFPILQAEIQKIKQMFPDDITCADSLPAFKHLLTPPKPNILKDIQPLLKNKIEEKSNISLDDSWDNEDYNELLLLATLSAENREIVDRCDKVSEISEQQCVDGEWHRRINESTPTRSTSRKVSLPARRKSRESNDVTPPPSPIKHNFCKTGAVKKKLPFNDGYSALKSFKLTDIYTYLTKRQISNAHRAETDALALLECITVLGPEFLNWVDSNNKPFNSVKKLW